MLGTRRALDAARDGGARRFVHLSSVTAFSFDYPDGVTEAHPIRPNGVPYVDTKVASEQVVFQAHAAGEVPCTVVRPGDVYGPRLDAMDGAGRWRSWPAGGCSCPPSGAGSSAPCTSTTSSTGSCSPAEREEGAGQVFTISDGVGVTTREFFGHYARLLGQAAAPRSDRGLAGARGGGDEIAGRQGEVSPAAVDYIARDGHLLDRRRPGRLLGYEPAVDLEEGMRRTTEWLRAEGYA